MSIIKTEFPSVEPLDENSGTVSNLLSSNNELDHFIGKYAIGCESPPDGNRVLEFVKENIYNGISHGCLNNDALRLDMINGLHNCSKDLDHNNMYGETHEMISNIIANSTLSDEAVRKKYGQFFFIDETFLERFFGFVKEDKEKTSYFSDAVKSDINRSTTYNYLKKNYAFIFGNSNYSTSLIMDTIGNNREDLFKIIEENQREKYPGLYIAKSQAFGSTLKNSAKGPHFYSFAERLLDMMNKYEIIRSRPQVSFSRDGLEGFLQILKNPGDISKERQEKLFCYYFYACSNDYNLSLEILMEQTCGSPNFPIDFVGDCIVRRPNVYSCDLYKILLESVLKRSSSESSRMEIGEDAFAMISHVVEFVYDNKNKNEYWVSPSAEKLSGLLNEVKEKGLIRKVSSFDKGKLMKLATGYLRSTWPEGHFKGYVSSVNELMEEGSNE